MQSAVAARARGPRPHPRPAPGAGRRRLGAGGGLRAAQPRPDLRHPRRVARGLGDQRRGRARLRARPRVGVLADRRGGHRARATGEARRAADAGRGRPRRQVRAGRRAARQSRSGLVRGLELGEGRREPLPPQPALLDRRRLVGRRPRRALPRRRRAVVERQAPGGVRRPDRLRAQPGARPRGARRRQPPGGAGAARAAAARRACRPSVLDAHGRAAVPDLVARGLLDRSAATGWSRPAPVGCSPTRSSATYCRRTSDGA